jgi:hypothetical protein
MVVVAMVVEVAVAVVEQTNLAIRHRSEVRSLSRRGVVMCSANHKLHKIA